MSNLKIELDGVLVTGRIDGTEKFETTIRRRDEAGALAKSFTGELTFYDQGMTYLKTKLIDDPLGFSKEVKVRIFDDCCHGTPVFTGVIQGKAIDWQWPICSITANVVEEKPEINCIKSTMIWDGFNGFLSRQFIPIRYCVEMRPEFIQYVILYLAFIVNVLFISVMIPIIAVILVIFSIIYVICSLIDLICDIPLIGCDGPDCNTGFSNPAVAINNIVAAFQEINEQIIPCGRFHPSPYVRDYVLNVCQKCGLTFQSSILNDPSSDYYNTVMVAAQVKKGRGKNDTDFTLIGDNKPVETLETLLENYLMPLFTADYRIVNGVLIFEREDFFQATSTWIDTEALLISGDLINDEVEFSWIDDPRPAFGRFEYPPDAVDYMGNEARTRWNELVDWNVPYSPSQSGAHMVPLPLGAARFRQDGIDTDVFTHFQTVLGGVINAIFFGAFDNYDRALLINQGIFFNYKFLIYNPASGSDGEIRHDYPDSFTGGPVDGASNERFNYPYWFVEGRDRNLYSNFHYINDPRLPGTTQFNFKFSFRFTCDQLQDFDFSKTVRLLQGGVVKNGQVNEIQPDFTNRIISVSGIV